MLTLDQLEKCHLIFQLWEQNPNDREHVEWLCTRLSSESHKYMEWLFKRWPLIRSSPNAFPIPTQEVMASALLASTRTAPCLQQPSYSFPPLVLPQPVETVDAFQQTQHQIWPLFVPPSLEQQIGNSSISQYPLEPQTCWNKDVEMLAV
jgi:hypothetical protein